MSSFRSINHSASIGQVRWPDLTRMLWRVTDAWLWRLEELNRQYWTRLYSNHYDFRRFLEQCLPHRYCTDDTLVMTAMDWVYEFQETYLCQIPAEELLEELALRSG